MKRAALIAIAVVCALSPQIQAAAPSGWFVAGSQPQFYSVDTDPAVTYQGSLSVRMASTTANSSGFGTLMQDFFADRYKGKRVRFSGFVKSSGVQRWAGLWMRIDSGYLTAFDNMQNRPIQGTTDWTPYSVVLDVSQSATGINLGILLDGPGTVWLSGVKFEVVDTTVPVTDLVNTPYDAVNLDFRTRSGETGGDGGIAERYRNIH